MRFTLALFLTLFTLPILAAAESLKIDGDIGSVEVERQIIVKEKYPLAKTLPVTITAPAGGFGYVWDIPANVKAVKKKNVLEITEAPKGILTVSVSWLIVDFGAMSVEDKSATITLVIAEIKPPTPPDPLTVELRAIYQADPSPDKAANLAKLTAVFSAAANAALTNQDAKTAAQLADAVRAISRSMLPADALSAIRKRCGEIMAADMPSNPDEPLTADTRTKASAVYHRIAKLLESIK